MSDSAPAASPGAGTGVEGAPPGPWRRFWRSPTRAVATGILGASAGAAYSHFIGCRTGTCLITSNVWIASLYGAGVGALVGWPSRREASRERAPIERG